jgi:hypothetical protein
MKRKIITNMNKDEIVELFDKGVIFMLTRGSI